MAEMCHKYDVLCVTDEVYEWLVYDDNVFTKIGELVFTADITSYIFLS